MICKYKKISIIYGTRGRKCAMTIQDLFTQKHERDIYPIKSYLLAKEYLSCNNVLQTVRDIIGSSDICIILLTYDDVNNTRVRQNILVEIGMAAVLLEPSRNYFFSEKIPLPEDFPSDLRHAINPNYFDPRKAEATAERITASIVKELKARSYKNILSDNGFIYDYQEIIRSMPSSIYELEAETQMHKILDEWSSSMSAFDYAAERIIYILERCIFLTLFRYNTSLSDFFGGIFDMIRPTEKDYEVFDVYQINEAYLLAKNILNYIDLVLRQTSGTQRDAAGQPMNIRWHQSFASIAGELETSVQKIRDGELPFNWYLYMMACDYAGLARMRAVRLGNLSQSDYEEGLKKANAMFENTNSLIRRHCIHSRYLWEGYTEYNISRIFELLYERDRREEYRQAIRDASQSAITARRKIVDDSVHLKGIFSIALTYEYFQALYHEYDLELKHPEVLDGDLDDMADRISAALAELNIFCDSSGLRQLYDMRDNLQALLSRTKN